MNLRGYNMHIGLTTEEAQRKLEQVGLNRLPEGKGRTLLRVFIDQFKNPLIYLLVAASGVTFFFGKVSDPIVVLGVALINAVVGTFQEGRAERSLRALRRYSQLRVRVLRDGVLQEILSEELVPGDLVHLVAGDGVPADGILVEAFKFQVSEAVLTGESLPLHKKEGQPLFSGTHVMTGKGVMEVEATGVSTELGKIALLTEKEPQGKTPIEARIDTFSRDLAIIAVGVAFLIIFTGWFRSIDRGQLVMAAVSEVVSIIPEGLPVAITIALAVGVQRMASKKAVVRKLSAVETLGSTSVICSDKTGTLTKNALTVKELSPDSDLLWEALILCNDASIGAGDPLESALLVAAHEKGIPIEGLRKQRKRIGEIPFSAEEKMMATEHEGGIVFIKGAYEVVSRLCEDNALSQEVEGYAAQGYRVLACAQGKGVRLNPDLGSEQFQGKMELIGVVSLYDPPRPEAVKAIQQCRTAGIRTVMATGDHLITAMAIAGELGILREGDEGITGEELEHLSAEDLKERCGKISVFARLHPEQKLKIVQAFQSRGEVVAVTGDGVNDAPALAQADVGVAMGIAGTDVAKEAAKMVILDDNFATIVGAVAEGRLVYQNLKKVIFYILSTSLAGALALLSGVLLGLPLIMNPLHILWINVVTEGTVTINLVMDPPFGDEMQRPPTARNDKILTRSKIFPMGLTIVWVGFLLLFTFIFRTERGISLVQAQTEVFTLFAFSAWFKLLSIRAEERSAFHTATLLHNRFLAVGLGVGFLLHGLVLYWEPMNLLFHTVPLHPATLAVLLLIASSTLALDEVRKLFSKGTPVI